MPASQSLVNLAQAVEDNTGGIAAAWYTLADDLLNFPQTGELVINQDLQLRPGATWYQLVATLYTLRHTQKPKEVGRHGELYAQQLRGVLARHTDGLAAGLEALAGRRLVVLYRDQNGRVQLLGTPDQPLTWKDDFDSGANPDSRNAYDFTLAGDTQRRARPYLGRWSVAGGSIQSAIIFQQGGGGAVVLRTSAGRVLATVPAGRSVVMRSGFAQTYQIV